jgi:hypothetical protein
MLHKNDRYITEAINETGDHEDKYIVFKISDVKWYDSYDDVKAHHKLMHEANELFGASYRFMAIGEDGAETYQEDGDVYDGLYDMLHSVHELRTTF